MAARKQRIAEIKLWSSKALFGYLQWGTQLLFLYHPPITPSNNYGLMDNPLMKSEPS
jgi:hypothetical protein